VAIQHGIKVGIKVEVLSSNHLSVIHLLFQLNIPCVGPYLLREILNPRVRMNVRI
jgi:hypothetical protein